MTRDRKHSTAGFRITVALVAALLYAASIGPACWISSRMTAGASIVSTAYRPLTWGMSRNQSLADAVSWYSKIGSRKGWLWVKATHWTWAEYDEHDLYSPNARAIMRDLGVD